MTLEEVPLRNMRGIPHIRPLTDALRVGEKESYDTVHSRRPEIVSGKSDMATLSPQKTQNPSVRDRNDVGKPLAPTLHKYSIAVCVRTLLSAILFFYWKPSSRLTSAQNEFLERRLLESLAPRAMIWMLVLLSLAVVVTLSAET